MIATIVYMNNIVVHADDHNRITLNPLEDYADHQGEYVNACFIDVSNQNLPITVVLDL